MQVFFREIQFLILLICVEDVTYKIYYHMTIETMPFITVIL